MHKRIRAGTSGRQRCREKQRGLCAVSPTRRIWTGTGGRPAGGASRGEAQHPLWIDWRGRRREWQPRRRGARRRPSPGCGGTPLYTASSAISPNARGGPKAPRHPYAETRNPAARGPRKPVAGPIVLHVPRALPRSRTGNSDDMRAIQRGIMAAAPIPCTQRPMTSQVRLDAVRTSAVPSVKITMPAMMRRRLSSPSLRRP